MRSGRRSLRTHRDRRGRPGGRRELPVLRPADARHLVLQLLVRDDVHADGPAAIATLVAPADFPAGATTPIAFVDPNDGRDRRLIATQQGAILVWDDSKDAMLPTMFLDLRSSSGGPVLFGGERGLLGDGARPELRDDRPASTSSTRAATRAAEPRGHRHRPLPALGRQSRRRRPGLGHHDHGRSSTPRPPTTTAASSPSGRTASSTSRPATAAAAATTTRARTATASAPNSLLGKLLRIDVHGRRSRRRGARRLRRGPGNYTVPSTNPFFGQEPGLRRGLGPAACATRSASPSTARTATSTSATSARTSGRS